MIKKSRAILGVIGNPGLVAVMLVTAFMGYLYVTNRTFDQTLATSLSVSSDWTEIRPDPPLRTRRRLAELAMTIPDYRAERGGRFEIKLPNGQIVQPQIQVVDANGSVYDLEHSGYTFTGDEDLIIFRPKAGDFLETTYTQVRIRSDIPFTCERIFWRESNPK